MISFSKHKIKFWTLLFAGIGIGGLILFFPVKINSSYTCLYHRLVQPNHHVNHGDDNGVIHSKRHNAPVLSTDSAGLGGHFGVSGSEESNRTQTHHMMTSSKLLNHYIHSYAVFWWGSVLLILTGLYVYRHLKENTNKKTEKPIV